MCLCFATGALAAAFASTCHNRENSAVAHKNRMYFYGGAAAITAVVALALTIISGLGILIPIVILTFTAVALAAAAADSRSKYHQFIRRE